MSYETTNRRWRERQWTKDAAEVFAFARDMTMGLRLDGADVLEVFERPEAFTREHAWWEDAGRPDDEATWEDARDDGYTMGRGAA